MSERERSERSDTLAAYTNSLLESRNWEVKLKNLRLEIKDLEKEFNQTEENIKALQSVGQIIGEVLKQLDEERCLSMPLSPFHAFPHHPHLSQGVNHQLFSLTHHCHSHRQSLLRPPLCCRLPLQGRPCEAEARNPRCPRHDDPHNHAYAAARSRPARL